jgi:predicted dehydrogenase
MKKTKRPAARAAGNKDRVRVGLVGAKFAADFHADSYRRDERVEVVAVADINRQTLDAFAAKWKVPVVCTDYHELLKRDDIDLVSVCVPNFLHHDVIVAAARAGKHIVCEKPLSITVADAREALEVCRAAGVKLFYAEDWVFAPALRKAIAVVREGAVGEVLFVKAKEVHNGTHSPFAKNARTCGGGSLIHLGIHPVGWAMHFLGREGRNPVVEVVGRTNGGGEGNYVHKDNTGEDWGLGIMKFAEGQHALVEGNYITVGGMDDKIEIYGTEGRLDVDLTFGSPLAVYSRPGYSYAVEKADNTLGWTRPAVDEFFNLGYVEELRYCVDCVLKDEPPVWGVSAANGLACIEVIDAMYRSNAEGRTIQGRW